MEVFIVSGIKKEVDVKDRSMCGEGVKVAYNARRSVKLAGEKKQNQLLRFCEYIYE